MEIGRKYLTKQIPGNYGSFPRHAIEQAYPCTSPVVCVRRKDDSYYPTYRGKGLLFREEYNLPLSEQAYRHLLVKADGIILTKKRYLILVEGAGHLIIEMNVLEGPYQDPVLAEAEFLTEEEIMAFKTPEWFGRDITFSSELQNSCLAYGDTNIPYKQV